MLLTCRYPESEAQRRRPATRKKHERSGRLAGPPWSTVLTARVYKRCCLVPTGRGCDEVCSGIQSLTHPVPRTITRCFRFGSSFLKLACGSSCRGVTPDGQYLAQDYQEFSARIRWIEGCTWGGVDRTGGCESVVAVVTFGDTSAWRCEPQRKARDAEPPGARPASSSGDALRRSPCHAITQTLNSHRQGVRQWPLAVLWLDDVTTAQYRSAAQQQALNTPRRVAAHRPAPCFPLPVLGIEAKLADGKSRIGFP